MLKKLSRKDLIVLVEPQPTQFGKLGGDPSYDIYTHANLPARGIHYVGAIAKQAGFTNIAYLNQYHGNINSYENRKLLSEAAVIGVSTIARTDTQGKELLDQYRDKITFAGGFQPTFRYEDFAKHADIVVRGEAEETFPELLETLAGERGSLEHVNGIVFRRDNQTIMTHDRRLLTPDQLTVHPDYDETTFSRVRTFSVEDSRGCPKNCNFCTVMQMYGRSFRNKTNDWMVEELARTKDYGRSVFFTGDNFIGNRKRAKSILESIIENGLNNKYGVIQATIQLADDPKLMELLWNAGIRSVCLGIESINDEILKALNKGYNGEYVKKCVKTIRDYGFLIHGMFIVGCDEDDSEKAKELSEWAPRNVHSAQFFALMPLPGSEVEKELRADKRLIYPVGEEHFYLYDGDHVLIKPKNFKNALDLQETIYDMYKNFYSWFNGFKRVITSPQKRVSLGLLAYTKFSERKVLHSPQSREHVRYLESVS